MAMHCTAVFLTEKDALVDQVKAGQRSDPQLKQRWATYCDVHFCGLRDPKKHDVDSLKRYLSGSWSEEGEETREELDIDVQVLIEELRANGRELDGATMLMIQRAPRDDAIQALTFLGWRPDETRGESGAIHARKGASAETAAHRGGRTQAGSAQRR